MQLDELGDVVDQVLRVAKRLQPLAGEPGTDHLVVVERHPATVLEPAGRRLADVVHEGGQAQREVGSVRLEVDRLLDHDEGVVVHVLVPVVLVDLELQRGQLGDEVVGEPGVHEDAEPGAGVVREHQLGELVPDPFRRHDLQPVGHGGDRSQNGLLDLEVELRGKPRGAQHAQRVIVEGVLGASGGAQRAGRESGHSVERIDEPKVGQRDCHGVHREVPAPQVSFERGSVLHHRLAGLTVVLLGAVGGDLTRQLSNPAPDRAEGLADVPDGIHMTRQQAFDLVGVR